MISLWYCISFLAYNNKIHFIIFNLDYLDHGDQNVECKACGAMLWLAESKRGATNSGNTDSFSICCGRGKVVLPVALKEPPELLTKLLNGENRRSKSFLDNIRRYNSMFAFTSMGANVDHSVNNGRAPYCFRIQGQNYHLLGDLLPKDGDRPKFSQLYIYDPQNEIQNRIDAVRYYNANYTFSFSVYMVILSY